MVISSRQCLVCKWMMASFQTGEKWKWPHGTIGGGLSHMSHLDPWWGWVTNSCCKTWIHQIIPPVSPAVRAEAFWCRSSDSAINEIPPAPAMVQTCNGVKFIVLGKNMKAPWSLNKIKAWQLSIFRPVSFSPALLASREWRRQSKNPSGH